MGIRDTIKKMVSGEIDMDKYENDYSNRLKKEQEERRKAEIKENRQKFIDYQENKTNSLKERENARKQKLEEADRLAEQSRRANEVNKGVNIPTSNNVLPTVNRITTNYKENLKDTKVRLTQKDELNPLYYDDDIQAMNDAKKINEDVKNGDYNSSISNLLTNIPEGIKSGIYGTANAFILPTANAIRKIEGSDKSVSDKLLDISEELGKSGRYAGKVNSNIDNGIVKTLSQVSNTVGNMIPAIASNVALPGSGLIMTALSSGGNSASETLNEDRTNLDKAIVTGVAKGTVEGMTEKITGGNILSKGNLDDFAEKTIQNKVKSNVGKYIASKGYEVGGEILEEQISDNTGYIIDKLVNDKEMPGFDEWWNNAGETTKVTFLSTIALNALGLGGSTYKESQDNAEINKWISEAEKIVSTNSNSNINQNEKELISKQLLDNKIMNKNRFKDNLEENNIKVPMYQDNVSKNQFLGENNKTLENIENNNQILYNNIESESDNNGTIQGFQRLPEQFSTRIHQESEQQAKKYTRQEYEQWEKSVKSIKNTELTEQQSRIKNDIKRQYNKDIVFFDANDTNYNGGASLTNANNIYININEVNKFGLNRISLHETLESNLRYNVELKNEIIDPVIEAIIKDKNFQEQKNKFWENQDEDIPSDYAIAKDILCDRFAEIKSGEELDYSNVLSNATNMNIDFAIENFESQLNSNKLPKANDEHVLIPNNNILEKLNKNTKKTLNPMEISKLTKKDANTAPKLNAKTYEKGNKQSSFLSNIITDAQFLNKDLRQLMSLEDNIKYYKGITNKETLERAYGSLQKNGQQEVIKWISKEGENANAEDIAKGWILLKQYQDAGDYQSAVEVAKKMRDIGTTAGQTIQAYNILSRLTPEGMFYYAQSELNEVYNKLVEGKSKEWIDKNTKELNLTAEDTQFIKETMKDVATMEDGYEKKVKLAEIQKLITDKIPAKFGKSIKAWMRISMLFNPKTQVRNIMGNATILPVNMFSDSISAGIDRIISKKTGIRTIGALGGKSYIKGFGRGLYESYNDFKKGINTRNIEGNRFEIGEGKSFKDKGIGKVLNRIDNMLSFMLDVGDRGFYEATFTRSINNQLVLNNTTKINQDMIDIATNEALQRTWQDNNGYTKAVLKIRDVLNGKVGKNKGMNYGLGDIIIPFAKTPANLTKAIIDYSPLGVIQTLKSGIKLKNSLQTGQYTANLQHQFVQNLGKATAGSFLYILGYALAEAGISTGEADEDKDMKNFMKNSLGISSYSIKIGDKSFTYDWAQPVAAPIAFMANLEQKRKENPNMQLTDAIGTVMNTGLDLLFEQSFMESINSVLNGNGTVWENLVQTFLELPSRAVPTIFKQITDMVDGTQRTSFEYNKPLESSINSIKAKVPGLSNTLPASTDTLGNEIQKYGGENNAFNVFLNPSNMNKGNVSKVGEEIYNIYKETGDTTIFPRVAPYYINSKGEKQTMTAKERASFQSVSGKYVENSLNSLLKDKDYKKLSNEKKAKIINEIVSDSYSKAKYDILNIDSKEYKKKRELLKEVSSNSYYNYKFKSEDLKKDTEKINILVKANYSKKEKQVIYEKYILDSTNKKYVVIKESGIDIDKYLQYKLNESKFTSEKKDDGTVKGKSITNSAKDKRYNYINSMQGVTYMQKAVLFGLEYTPNNTDKKMIVNYITSLPNKKKNEKIDMLSKFQWITIYKDSSFNY